MRSPAFFLIVVRLQLAGGLPRLALSGGGGGGGRVLAVGGVEFGAAEDVE